jgi:hypothetical protein
MLTSNNERGNFNSVTRETLLSINIIWYSNVLSDSVARSQTPQCTTISSLLYDHEWDVQKRTDFSLIANIINVIIGFRV